MRVITIKIDTFKSNKFKIFICTKMDLIGKNLFLNTLEVFEQQKKFTKVLNNLFIIFRCFRTLKEILFFTLKIYFI